MREQGGSSVGEDAPPAAAPQIASFDEFKAAAAGSDIAAAAEMLRILTNLRYFVPPRLAGEFYTAAARFVAEGSTDPWSCILGVLVQDGELNLEQRRFRFPSLRVLPTVLEEILIRQEYHFGPSPESPLILDCGANIGLASFFFRKLYPTARIRAYEPSSDVRRYLEHNVRRNGFSSVEIFPFAVAAEEGEVTFHNSDLDPMAGSILAERAQKDVRTETVRTVPLSSLIDEPVAMLKLDIEGMEADALEEAEDKLSLVSSVFCETHQRPGQNPSNLARVLNCLERAGFMTHVARSPWSEQQHSWRPMRFARLGYSSSIFATR